jgi:putative tricarboxylic transport membrane protein
MWESIVLGLGVGLEPANLLYAFVGALIGTLVGVLPGLGPSAAISLLLPMSFKLSPVGAIIMLAGIYYGAMYGGSTTAILVNIPGEAASVMTTLDGYQMARRGRAGAALGISAFGSFIAGTLSVLGLMVFAPPLAELALRFGPPEYTALMVLGFVILTFLVSGSMAKALMMVAFGVFLSTVGLDAISGTARFTMKMSELMDGVGLVPVIMGLFGITEVLLNLEQTLRRSVLIGKIQGIMPTRADWRRALPAILRGTGLGFVLGLLPGGGSILASFVSYAVEKRISSHREEFGEGAIEGVAGPESANNAGAGASFVPLLTLGIPSNSVMAILLGALMIHGIQPGPLLMQEHPDLVWGVIMSMYLGNAMLLVLNLPLIGLWVHLLRVPYAYLFPFILLFSLVGAYSGSNTTTDVVLMVVFGVLGYWMRKTGYEAAPLVLGLVLGGMFENALRQSLLLSDGSPAIFFSRPLSLLFMLTAIVLLLFPLVPRFRGRRPGVGVEGVS